LASGEKSVVLLFSPAAPQPLLIRAEGACAQIYLRRQLFWKKSFLLNVPLSKKEIITDLVSAKNVRYLHFLPQLFAQKLSGAKRLAPKSIQGGTYGSPYGGPPSADLLPPPTEGKAKKP